jgi:sigma-B regulation protein RsbU (phosphoserine phosphatase)
LNYLYSKVNSGLSLVILSVLILSLFIYRIFFFVKDSFWFFTLNDLLVIISFVALSFYLLKIIRKKNPSPSNLVFNIGIINAFIFLVIIFSEKILNLLFENFSSRISNPGLLESIIYTIYFLIFFVITAYLLISFKELYFHKQNRGKNTYFIAMLVFMGLTSITGLFFTSPEYKFVNNTFLIISIILIVINSIKISWIAFIVKKEKLSLLLLSVIILTLFILNLTNSGAENFHGEVLKNISPSFQQFFNLILLYGAIYFSVLFFTTLFHIPTAEAYDRKAKEVSSLQYFSKLITEVLDFKELAETITDIATKVSSADASWIVLKQNGDLKIISNKNIALLDADLINQFLFESGICEKITETKICNLNKFARKSQLSEKYGSVAVSPLRSYNEIKGYLIAVRKNELIFYEDDKAAINTFSDYASVAMENSMLLEQSIEKERLEKELDVAREIQRKILPAKDPVFNNLSISSVFIPAFEVGGDYYDFFEISKDKVGFVIADVSGKGISAAFIMAEIKGIFESLSRMIESPKGILVKANHILKSTLDNKNFVSALYGLIDIKKEELYFSRAGHCPAILLRDGKASTFKPSGIGLGLTNDKHFIDNLEEFKVELKQGDNLIIYTDGITEAKNKDLEDFGDKRFTQILLNNANESVHKITNEVIKEVTLFSRDHTQYDDITLVILKWDKKNNYMEINNGRV